MTTSYSIYECTRIMYPFVRLRLLRRRLRNDLYHDDTCQDFHFLYFSLVIRDGGFPQYSRSAFIERSSPPFFPKLVNSIPSSQLHCMYMYPNYQPVSPSPLPSDLLSPTHHQCHTFITYTHGFVTAYFSYYSDKGTWTLILVFFFLLHGP